jgi:anti-sigma factor (TIGR02949 family)
MTSRSVIDCEAALQWLADYLNRELEPAEHDAVEQHVSQCRACFARAEFERRLKERLTDLGREEAPANVQSRIRKLLGGF